MALTLCCRCVTPPSSSPSALISHGRCWVKDGDSDNSPSLSLDADCSAKVSKNGYCTCKAWLLPCRQECRDSYETRICKPVLSSMSVLLILFDDSWDQVSLDVCIFSGLDLMLYCWAPPSSHVLVWHCSCTPLVLTNDPSWRRQLLLTRIGTRAVWMRRSTWRIFSTAFVLA